MTTNVDYDDYDHDLRLTFHIHRRQRGVWLVSGYDRNGDASAEELIDATSTRRDAKKMADKMADELGCEPVSGWETDLDTSTRSYREKKDA